MSTSLSIHYVTDIRADHNPEIPALSISIYGDSGIPHSVTLFCDDAVFNKRLAEAINKVSRERHEEKVIVQSEQNDVADYNHRPDDEEIVF